MTPLFENLVTVVGGCMRRLKPVADPLVADRTFCTARNDVVRVFRTVTVTAADLNRTETILHHDLRLLSG